MPSYVTDDGQVHLCRMGYTSDGVYYCTGHDFETDSKREFQDHRSNHHPIWCDRHGAGEYVKAAYRYDNGRYYYDYCAEHAAEAWDDNEYFRKRVERQPRVANGGAERLPDDHPVEQAIGGDA